MLVSMPADLPLGGGGRWPLCGVGFQSVQWADLEVGYTVADPMNASAAYERLPSHICPCPHYGYIFKGRLRCTYPVRTGRTWWPRPATCTSSRPAIISSTRGEQGAGAESTHALQALMNHVETFDQRMVGQDAG